MNKNDFSLFDMSKMERVEVFDGITFGRDSSCNYIIKDKAVSGAHFKIMIVDFELYVVDLDSSNNTFLNDTPINPNQKYKLKPRDVIRLGEVEFSYSTEAVSKLELPSLNSSLKIDKFQIDNSILSTAEVANLEDSFSENDFMPGIESIKSKNRPDSDLKSLRSAKKYLEELEEVSDEINQKIGQLKKMRRRKIDVGAKLDKCSQVLSNCEFITEKDFENELRIHRGTAEGIRMKAKKENKIIEAAKEAIEQAHFNLAGFGIQIKKSKDKETKVSGMYEKFKNKTILKNELETLRTSIGKYEGLSLEGKQLEVIKEMKIKKEQLKTMQSHYGAKINLDAIKTKAADE